MSGMRKQGEEETMTCTEGKSCKCEPTAEEEHQRLWAEQRANLESPQPAVAPAPEDEPVWMVKALAHKATLVRQHAQSEICLHGGCGCIDRIDEIDHIISDARSQPVSAAPSREPSPDIVKLIHCLAFFASVIKCGEPWTDTCQHEYEEALASWRGNEQPVSYDMDASSWIRI
jgi:hypothetical protein